MPRTYALKPSEGPISRSLKAASDKAKTKALALAALPIPGPFEHKGVTVRIERLGLNGRLLEVVARGERDGSPVLVDNPILFLNPPICVPNGTFRKEAKRPGSSESVDVPNCDENLSEALKQIVGEVFARAEV